MRQRGAKAKRKLRFTMLLCNGVARIRRKSPLVPCCARAVRPRDRQRCKWGAIGVIKVAPALPLDSQLFALAGVCIACLWGRDRPLCRLPASLLSMHGRVPVRCGRSSAAAPECGGWVHKTHNLQFGHISQRCFNTLKPSNQLHAMQITAAHAQSAVNAWGGGGGC